MVGAMEYVTLGVSDMDESVRLFRDVMQLDVEAEYIPSNGLLSLWGIGGAQGARVVELSCSGYPVGRLRLLATDPPRTVRVRDDHGGPDTATDVGVKAIDFYVRPPIRRWIDTLENAGCRARSEPIRWEIGTVESEEINISGPDGYPMLLMVAWRHPPAFRRRFDAAKPFSEVATTSVVCGDLDASRHYYGEVLGLTKFTDDEVEDEYRELANTLTGVPSGTRVRLTLYGAEGEPSGKLLLVHFYEASVRRLDGRMRPSHLGVAMFTHTTGDIEGLHRRVLASGNSVLAGPAEVPEYGGRVMVVTGPNDELFEIVQADG